MSGDDDQSTRDLMKALDEEAFNEEESQKLEQAHIDQDRREKAAREKAEQAEQAELEKAAEESQRAREAEAGAEPEQVPVDEGPAVEETSQGPDQSPLDPGESRDTRDLMDELDQEYVNLEASDALEQAHIDQDRAEQAELEQAAAENERVIDDARLEEANRELQEFQRDEAAGIDREASAELQRAHQLEEAAQDAANLENFESAGEVAGGQGTVATGRAGTMTPNVMQNVVIGVIAIATLIGGAALMRNRARTTRPPAPTSTPVTQEAPTGTRFFTAVVEVEYIHKFPWLDHRITYRATAHSSTGPFGVGSGEGEYRERGESTPEGEEPCSVIRSGPVTMRLEITPSLKELAAKIQGPVVRQVTGRSNCSPNVDQTDRADITCVFHDVDFVRGGRYRAEDHPPELWDGNINQETCTMVLTPDGK